MRRALLLVLMLALTLSPAEARHYGHRHGGLWGLFSIPYAHRHGYRHHRYARHKTHSRTEAVSDGSPGRSYTTAELVPSGWQLQPTDPNLKGQRFASPDGEGSLAIYATSAEQEPIAKHMNAIAFVEGEQITHLRSEEDWIEVAGFKADHSFYRKAVLACAGRVWHEVAFEYPTQSLRRDKPSSSAAWRRRCRTAKIRAARLQSPLLSMSLPPRSQPRWARKKDTLRPEPNHSLGRTARRQA